MTAAARVDVLVNVESSEAAFVVQNSVKQRNISQRHRQIGKLTFEADRRREFAPVMSALSDGLVMRPVIIVITNSRSKIDGNLRVAAAVQ